MAKTVEQRKKEVANGEASMVSSTWTSDTAEFKDDLNAPIFKNQGNMAAFASNYDKALSSFEDNMEKRNRARQIFQVANTQLDKMHSQMDGFKKDLDDVVKDAAAARKYKADAEELDDILGNWEETLKAQVDLNKERKSIFDNWMKFDTEHAKILSDTIAKVKKEVGAIDAALASSNTQLNALEGQIRNLVTKYDNIARSMNKPKIGAAVRGFLRVFG